MSRRGCSRLASLVVLAGLCACKGSAEEAGSASEAESPKVIEGPSALPANEAEFLALLAPLPGEAEAIELRYEIRSSDPDAKLEGDMRILLAPGGRRREQWELRSGEGEDAIVTQGTTLATPDEIWSAVDGSAGEIAHNHLGSLARAFLAMSREDQRAVIAAIRNWQEVLAKQRAEQPGDTTTVAGVSCLQTRIAAQNLCLWEQTGQFLRYRGSAFTIEAIAVDRAASVDADSFALPKSASSATRVEVEPMDPRAVLNQLVEGNYAAMAKILAPGLRLPELSAPDVD